MEKKTQYIDFKRIERALKLDKTVYKEIRDDKDAMTPAIVVLLLSAVIGGIWNILGSLGMALIGIVIGVPLGWLIGTGILHIIAKLFGGKSTYSGYLKAVAYAEVPMALGVVPVVGNFVGGIWSLVCVIYATKEAQEISMGKAIAVVLIPVVILVILALVASMYFISMFSGMYPQGHYGY
jgi:hypothetical protein